MKNTKKAVCKAGKAREKAKADKTARAKRIVARESGENTSKDEANVKAGNFGRCWLCLEEKPLVNSHIFSKRHVGEMRSEKGHFCEVNFDGEWGLMRKVQDFHKPLFCRQCDQQFSPVERDYLKWWKRLRLGEKSLKSGRHYTIDCMGKWSEVLASNPPVITLTGVDMDLLKRMQLINIFRLHCYIAFKHQQGDSPVVRKYRRIVQQFLGDKHGNLADFTVNAVYVCFFPEGQEISPNKPLDILPAPALTMGRETVLYGHACCFIGPVFWQIEEKADDIKKTSLTLKFCAL